MNPSAPRLILASGSPRRRELLTRAGYDFDVAPPAIGEISNPGLTLRETTCCNALRKGLSVAREHPEEIVLAADTLVALDRDILGKPADMAEARRMLVRLSGRRHFVATGVFIGHFASGQIDTFVVLSQVIFQRWGEQQIADYLKKIHPLDKAGAYAAQGNGRAIVMRIVGSRSNVIGLPLDRVRPALARFGIRPRITSVA